MKNLYVVRHAKSSWSLADARDFDRPLNKRGTRDAPRMGKFLRAEGVSADRLVTSPAVRAWTTAKLIAHELGYPVNDIDAEPRFYDASVQDTLEVLRTFPAQWSTVMIFGHNPTTTSFVNWVTGADIDNVPTCGVAHVRLPGTVWTAMDKRKAELVAFYTPKEILVV